MVRKIGSDTKTPPSHRVSWVSKSIFHTLIVSLQGVQAAYITAIHPIKKEAVPGHPLPYIFFPLALLGLLRLPAALWLTEEYGYREGEDRVPQRRGNEEMDLLLQEQAPPTDGKPLVRFYPQWSWKGIVVRIVFLGALLAMTLGVVLAIVMRWGPATKHSLSALLTGVYYLFLLTCTTSTLLIYILMGKGNTTVIPCIESPFYKAYTYSLFSLSIGYIVIAALETRRTACGLYTTSPIEWKQDNDICNPYKAY